MEELPFPLYGEKERIYRRGEGFQPLSLGDYMTNDGLSYTTLWSIGCPFHCSYCGNTKFIANDAQVQADPASRAPATSSSRSRTPAGAVPT